MHAAQEPRAKGAQLEGYFIDKNNPISPISIELRCPTSARGGRDPSEGILELMDGPKTKVL